MATIIGNRIIGGGTPVPADVPQNNLTGYQWQDGLHRLYEWNPGTSQWVYIGYLNNAGYGKLDRAGGTMTGSIGGAHSLAPISNPNFLNSAKRDNIDLATMDDLAALETKINATIDSKISSSIATVNSSIAFSNNIKIVRELINVTHGVDTNLPSPGTWPDGTPIKWSDCVWTIYPVAIGRGPASATTTDVDTIGDAEKQLSYKFKRLSENPAKFRLQYRIDIGGGAINTNMICEYVIIAVRS